MLRLKGAFLGYNSLDPPMELWPDANWGKLFKYHNNLLIPTCLSKINIARRSYYIKKDKHIQLQSRLLF